MQLHSCYAHFNISTAKHVTGADLSYNTLYTFLYCSLAPCFQISALLVSVAACGRRHLIIIIVEKMEAGLRGLCIREIDVKSQILVTKYYYDQTWFKAVSSSRQLHVVVLVKGRTLVNFKTLQMLFPKQIINVDKCLWQVGPGLRLAQFNNCGGLVSYI